MTTPNSYQSAREQARSDRGGTRPPDALAPDRTHSTPRMVIRGERPLPDTSNDASNPKAALIDWLNCTFPLQNHPSEISKFLDGWASIVGSCFKGRTCLNRGHAGWTDAYNLGSTNSIFAIGGQRGTAFLSLDGSSCALIPQDAWESVLHYLSAEYGARITRIDLAHDDFMGTHSVDWAVKQYRAGGFSSGGRKPSVMQHGDWIGENRRGRTLNVGTRRNGKTLRVYEKGKQLGDPSSEWVRWELELHNTDRDIPWDVLITPGNYLSGAYPSTGWISDNASRIKTRRKADSISEAVLTESLRQSYGSHLNYLKEKYGCERSIFKKILRDGVPKRLRTGPVMKLPQSGK